MTECIKGTILDFTEPHSIGERSAEVKPRGYDTNYVLNTTPKYDKDDKLHFVGRYWITRQNAHMVTSSETCSHVKFVAKVKDWL